MSGWAAHCSAHSAVILSPDPVCIQAALGLGAAEKKRLQVIKVYVQVRTREHGYKIITKYIKTII